MGQNAVKNYVYLSCEKEKYYETKSKTKLGAQQQLDYKLKMVKLRWCMNFTIIIHL